MAFQRRILLGAVLLAAGGCGDAPLGPVVEERGAPFFVAASTDAYDLSYSGTLLGAPSWDDLLNADGSRRIADAASYEAFRSRVAPLLDAWAADTRLGIDPNYVAALLTKESGFDSLAVSWDPANGYPQMTHVADLDLREMATAAGWDWMRPELESWPRDSRIHSWSAERQRTLDLLASGEVTAENEYFFDPVLSTRGAVFWLRLLVNRWTTDTWPGGYGSFARDRLNGGAPLSSGQIFDLVTVSYNQGYVFVYDLVERFGRDWTHHIGAGPGDYLERVRTYYDVYAAAPPDGGDDGAGEGDGEGDGGGDGEGDGEGDGDDAVAPAAPGSLNAKQTGRRIRLNWDDVAGEDGYRLYRSVDQGPFQLLSTHAAGVTSAADTDLRKRAVYVYAVAAFNAHGESALTLADALSVR